MSEELQSLVQIIELYGRGLGGLGKAIRFSAKGAAKRKPLDSMPEMASAFTALHHSSITSRQ